MSNKNSRYYLTEVKLVEICFYVCVYGIFFRLRKISGVHKMRGTRRMTNIAPQSNVSDDIVVITLPKRFTQSIRRIAIQRGMSLEAFMLVCVAEYEKAKREQDTPPLV